MMQTPTKPETTPMNAQQKSFWLEKAWPEGAQMMSQLREKALGAVKVDAKTKAMIQLACVSLQRCKHCTEGTVKKLKADFKLSDQEIAEVMMVASYAAGGTNMAWAAEVFDACMGH